MNLKRNNHNFARLALILVMAILPSVMTAILIPTQAKVPLTDFFPVSPNDQNEYWHQIATFNSVGLNGGYYTHLEKTAFITESRFGVHGPFYILLLGLLSKLTGWTYVTPIFFNMFFIALGFILFTWFSNLNTRQIILAGLSLSFFPPVLIYLPTAMQESLHQMAGMVFALIFGFSLTNLEKLSGWHKLGAILFTLIASLNRPSWALLFFPLFALYFPRNMKGQLKGLLLSVITILCIVVVLGMFITPGNNTITQAAEQFTRGFRAGVVYIYGTATENLKIFLTIASPLRLVFRIEYILILVFSFGMAVTYWIRNSKKSIEKRFNEPDFKLFFFIFLAIFPIIIWSFSLYFMKNDFRFIAPYFLLVLFLLIFHKKESFAIVFILVNLLIFPSLVSQFSNPISSNFIYSKEEIKKTGQIIEQSIFYQAGQTNAWCNTVLLPVTLYDYRIALIPPGIGVSYVLDNNGIDQITFPIKSKYLILTPLQMKEVDKNSLAQLDLIAEFPDSQLFLNKAANCS
jgi:hypothetical protein